MLRKIFPEQTWQYVPAHFTWYGTDFQVFGQSNNYDEEKGTHMVNYIRSDTYEVIQELGYHLQKCD